MPANCGKLRPPASLFALGHTELPLDLTVEGRPYQRRQLFKHDFFAATALYERADDSTPDAAPLPPKLIVLKVQRTHSFYGFPLKWLGRFVAYHESTVYQKLQGIRGIPRFLGRIGPTGFLHEFIPGADLHAGMTLSPDFFNELSALFEAIHERRVAYVDANKRENILHGADGKPWLIDFQISYLYGPWRGGGPTPLGRWMLRRLIRADWYHFHKHKTRLLPSACTPDDFEKARCPGKLHYIHRLFARPFIHARRKILARYDLAKTR